MIRIVFLLIFVLTFGLMIFLAVKTYRKNTELSKLLGTGIVLSSLVLTFYGFNCIAESTAVMEMLCCLEHAFITGVVYLFTLFTFEFVGKTVKREFMITSGGFVVVDAALLLTDPINHFVADIDFRQGKFFTAAVFSARPLFYYHIILILAFITIQAVVFVKTIRATSKYYYSRYVTLIFAYLIIAVPTGLYLFIDKGFDYSRVMYGLGAFLVYYDTYMFSPRNLINKLRAYVDDNILDATIIYDVEGEVIHINRAAKILIDKSVWIKKQGMMDYLGNPDEGTIHREIGSQVYEVLYSPVYDGKGVYVASTFVFHDITEVEKRHERDHKAATFDVLTRSFNRQGFFEQAEAFMAKNESREEYVMLVNGITDFKGINSLYGTHTGDRVLTGISEKFHGMHHEFPMIYGRAAEGKFVCIMPASRLEEVVSEFGCFHLTTEEGVEIHIDMCHGYVVMNDLEKPLEHYYELALLALAKSKATSVSGVVEYSEEMEKEQHRRQMLISEMHEAIERREFFIELQPQVSFSERKVTGAEALVRWKHPTLGVISPGEFIPLFESNGFITELDRFVWEKTADTIRKLSAEDKYHGSISVNVSRIDVMKLNVTEVFVDICEKYGIERSKLHIEITESACVDAPERLVDTMKELRSLGFIVEIDDFGSGYSSLNALTRMPFDVVKLDMMFMRFRNKLSLDDKSDIVIESIVEMLHKLKAEIIVEGVETEENVNASITFGADMAQGYLFSRPVSVTDFVDFVASYADN